MRLKAPRTQIQRLPVGTNRLLIRLQRTVSVPHPQRGAGQQMLLLRRQGLRLLVGNQRPVITLQGPPQIPAEQVKSGTGSIFLLGCHQQRLFIGMQRLRVALQRQGAASAMQVQFGPGVGKRRRQGHRLIVCLDRLLMPLQSRIDLTQAVVDGGIFGLQGQGALICRRRLLRPVVGRLRRSQPQQSIHHPLIVPRGLQRLLVGLDRLRP